MLEGSSLRLIITGGLLLHGLGHGGAIGALAWIKAHPDRDTGGWRVARSWALPALRAQVATWLACGFWVVALVGFVTASLAYAGWLLPQGLWQPVAIASAVVSTLGIVLFAGTWPVRNTLAAMAVNLLVLATLFGQP